jgi:putative hydroxymethylpyrimidine transport system substrate-binding protein
MDRRQLMTAALGAGAFLAAPSIARAQAAEKFTVLLDWFVNPDHATLVLAREKGLFRAAGLDVDLIPPTDPSAPPRLVAAKQADVAVSYQPNLHLQAAEGLPNVRIGTLVATPLNCLVSLDDGPVRTLADLKGKTVGFSVGGFEDAILSAMLKTVGLSLSDVKLVNINFALTQSLLAGRVDAVIGAFRNFELTQIALAGRKGRAFYPEQNGVPAYDELIAIAHRDRVADPKMRRFIDALEQASLILVNEPDASWDVFKGAYPKLDDELNRRAWKDTLPRFSKSPAALDTGRYERFAKFLGGTGLLKKELPALASYAVELPR